MSDALEYLVKVRGDALGHYFKFLKDSGKHLDTRSRDLISVITKVHQETEAGFKQYLMRALRNGARPIEIVDALLMAFPALGLAKIVWAAEILLEMDIPEFRPELINARPRWHDVMAAKDVAMDEIRRTDCDGRGLFIYRAGKDEFKVYDSRCPHQVTDIPDLALKGKNLTCPKHHWEFDITSGACIKIGKHPLRQFESRVTKGRIEAHW
jgi:nitrite reductase/ring-hydroxylating ferredoxin subunit